MPTKIVITSLFSKEYQLKKDQNAILCADCSNPSIGTNSDSNEEACLYHYYSIHSTKNFIFWEYDRLQQFKLLADQVCFLQTQLNLTMFGTINAYLEHIEIPLETINLILVISYVFNPSFNFSRFKETVAELVKSIQNFEPFELS